MRWLLSGAAIASALLASSCFGNPYAIAVNSIDYGQGQSGGVVTFTDPKIYRREALINERDGDLSYLKKLLEESATDKVKFDPEITRELEEIFAFAGAIGLAFDPASAVAFARSRRPPTSSRISTS